jgi:hypothetical protein
VDWFCRYVDNHLQATDEKGKPLYTLERLLGTEQYATVKRAR